MYVVKFIYELPLTKPIVVTFYRLIINFIKYVIIIFFSFRNKKNSTTIPKLYLL